MTYKKNNPSMPDATLVPASTAGKADPTKRSPTLDARFTVLIPLAPDSMTIHFLTSDFPSKTPIPVPTNTSVDPTETFKTIVSNINQSLPFLVAPISYEPETLLLHMEDLNQELIDASYNYKTAVPPPKKNLCLKFPFHCISLMDTFMSIKPIEPRPRI